VITAVGSRWQTGSGVAESQRQASTPTFSQNAHPKIVFCFFIDGLEELREG
jgi:hypothetical protein